MKWNVTSVLITAQLEVAHSFAGLAVGASVGAAAGGVTGGAAGYQAYAKREQ